MFNDWEYTPLQYWLQHICKDSGIQFKICMRDTWDPSDKLVYFVKISRKALKKNPVLVMRELGINCRRIEMTGNLKDQDFSISLDFYMDSPTQKMLTQEQLSRILGFRCDSFETYCDKFSKFSISFKCEHSSLPYYKVSQVILPRSGKFFYHSPKTRNICLFKRIAAQATGYAVNNIREALDLAISEKSILFFDYHPANYKSIKILRGLKYYEKKHIILLSHPSFQTIAENLARKSGIRFINPYEEAILPVKKFYEEIQNSQLVMIDDFPPIHDSWENELEKKHGIKSLRFFTYIDLIDHIHLLNERNPIYIDSSLGAGVRGEVVAKFLKENFRFGEIFLQTFHPMESVPYMWWITDILCKGECPVSELLEHFSEESEKSSDEAI